MTCRGIHTEEVSLVRCYLAALSVELHFEGLENSYKSEES